MNNFNNKSTQFEKGVSYCSQPSVVGACFRTCTILRKPSLSVFESLQNQRIFAKCMENFVRVGRHWMSLVKQTPSTKSQKYRLLNQFFDEHVPSMKIKPLGLLWFIQLTKVVDFLQASEFSSFWSRSRLLRNLQEDYCRSSQIFQESNHRMLILLEKQTNPGWILMAVHGNSSMITDFSWINVLKHG